ncbi:metalloregulator ArsR/SmtB family transcription factor [Parasphingorhabdus sp.]|uniref:ArsR/SmtB family transcription factor n=1 Tax=Parasphingorhabdus sp. TaxID=2709688 RepID=UPI0032658E12
MTHAPMDLEKFTRKAGIVANLLKSLSNGRRLMLLCKLVEKGEMTVGEAATEIGVSQSVISQHLARLRTEGLVTFRRDRQTLWYRIADDRVEALMTSLYALYCQD